MWACGRVGMAMACGPWTMGMWGARKRDRRPLEILREINFDPPAQAKLF